MTSFDPFPEKLPSITMISQQRQSQQEQQGTDAMFSQDMAYSTFIPHHHTDMYTNVNISPNPTDSDIPLALYDQQTQQHLSSPLTPSLSPPGIMDPTQFKRKYSVDVGPFAFNAHPSLMHDQDAYRRSSCSAMSVDNWAQHQDSPHQQQHPYQIQQMNQHNDYQQPTYNNDCAYYDDQGLSPLTDDLDTITSIKHDPTMINNGNLTMAMTTTNYSNKAKKRRLGQHYQQGPNAPHKHVCKYSYCGWSFKRYEHLKRHMLVHTGERPHVCVFPGCGKSFSRSDNFHAHYRTHTKKQSPESHLGLQQHHLHHSQYIPTPTPRGARKENSSGAPESTMTDSPSSASSSSILSNQDLLHGVSSQPFVFNGNKPFDMSYPDVYDQRSFTSDMNDQYSSQSYLPLEMDSQAGLTSLMNHDQVSSSVFVTNDLASTYDLQGTYGDFHSNASMPPHSPTSPSTFTSTPTTKKQRKHRSTLLHCDTTDDGQQQHKSHVCPMTQCQRRFKRLEHLKRHMRIHTLERPFACTFPKCHKHFSRSDNLSQHMKTHQNRIGQDKRRSSTSSSSSPCTSSSSSSSPVSPRSVMDDFASPNLINQQYYPSSSAIDTCSEVISSFPSCWPTESIGC